MSNQRNTAVLKKLTGVVYGCVLLAQGLNAENASDFAGGVIT